ncbi:hypothetical protein B0H15DRAFT_300228 [Mycena belliarum]|uniref:BTB domain-containing protein n=1 Tax=Mycena belliarum TaxID=1033014 RepID=A0AAD6XU77_9AGAR|nr:hypothetical protein B0H15DRAFT_300228 [Mycena belliae]
MSEIHPAATTHRDALAPFSGALDPEENIPASDFILRSGDSVDFHVHRDVLKFVSVFFKNMLDGAGADIDLQRDGKPIVILSEPSAVLYRLLCLAYPTLERHSLAVARGLDGLWEVYQMAKKYLFFGVEKLVKQTLEDHDLLDTQPHRMFAIARLCALPDLARAAALCTLKSAVCPEGLRFPEMAHLTADVLQELYQFHHTCGIAAQAIAENNADYFDAQYAGSPLMGISSHDETDQAFVWWDFGTADFHHHPGCGPSDLDGPRDPDTGQQWPQTAAAPWFHNHVAKVAPRLRALPIGDTAAELLKVAPEEQAIIDTCQVCSASAVSDLASFVRRLSIEIEESNSRLVRNL